MPEVGDMAKHVVAIGLYEPIHLESQKWVYMLHTWMANVHIADVLDRLLLLSEIS
jgi:hypothetical protein